jgi:hypothetical protein
MATFDLKDIVDELQELDSDDLMEADTALTELSKMPASQLFPDWPPLPGKEQNISIIKAILTICESCKSVSFAAKHISKLEDQAIIEDSRSPVIIILSLFNEILAKDVIILERNKQTMALQRELESLQEQLALATGEIPKH